MFKTIQINQYSNDWPKLFADEAERLGKVLPGIKLEHIGSTAVEGLAAKPVIDMMGGVSNLKEVKKCIEPLAVLGYVYAPELEVQTPDRKFFQKRQDSGVWYHLSLTEPTSIYWRDHILFRDYLRDHAEARVEYDNLKKELAARYVDDFDQYNAAKTNFINSIIQKALN